jgi:hypothetical protein
MPNRASHSRSDAESAALRGGLVVFAAVVVGAVILASMSTATRRVTAAAGTTPTTLRQPTVSVTTPTVPAHSPSSVKVLVLNGVDPKKAIAKPAAATVATGGFTTLPPGDAKQVVAESVVYFVAGYQTDAKTVAALLSIPPAAVVALSTPTPPEVGDPADAHVIVVVGPDLPIAGQ